MNPNPSSNRLRRLFTVRDLYDDPLDKGVAQGILVINWILLVGLFVRLTAQLVVLGGDLVDFALPVFGIALALSVSFALARGQLRQASQLLVFFAVAGSGFVILFTEQSATRFLTTLMSLVLAGVLLDRAGIIVTGTVLVIITLMDAVARLDPASASLLPTLADVLVVGMNLTIATAIQAVFVGRQRLIAEQALTTVEGLQRVLAETEAIDLGMSRDDVLSSMIRLYRRTYHLDSVQVYLADSEGRLVQLVRAGLRRTEIIDLDENEMHTLGETHPLSDAARFQEPIHITLEDSELRREYFMPAIQQGLVLPLVDGEELLGVVDIQSAQPKPMTSEQVRTMALIAGSFATLANLLRSNEVLSQSLREQEVVASRAQSQLASEQAQRREMVTNIWSEYIDQRGVGVVGFDVADKRLTPAADMPDEMREALAQRGEYLRVSDDEKVLSVPILLRGETLGAMSFSLTPDHVVTERQIELAKTIALRLGTALESTRLLEQTRLRAARERKATEISTLLFGASDVEALLKLAADNFNDTLGAIQTRIFVEPGALTAPEPPTSPPEARPNGTNGHNSNGDHA